MDRAERRPASEPAGAPPWEQLTRVPLKARLYEEDIYFREGWAALAGRHGAWAAALAQSLALLLVKPDGLIAGKTGTILDFASAHGFVPVLALEPRLGPRSWRELWQYQLNAATLDRLAVNDLIMPGKALMLLLRDERQDRLPASVRFQSLKGSSAIAGQAEGCLRQRLGQRTRTLSFVHCADEPADLVREIAILFSGSERDRVLERLAGRELPRDERTRLAGIASRRPAADPLDPKRALRRLRRVIERSRSEGRSSGGRIERLLETVSSMEEGQTIGWRAFHQALCEAGIRPGRWTLAVVASHHIVADEPGRSKTLPPLDHRLWLGSTSSPS